MGKNYSIFTVLTIIYPIFELVKAPYKLTVKNTKSSPALLYERRGLITSFPLLRIKLREGAAEDYIFSRAEIPIELRVFFKTILVASHNARRD